jgi:GntR family transcriptional regulator/MocR family aminotransferase
MVCLNLDKESGSTLIKQVYSQIRSMILRGELNVDSRLPSTRELAHHMNISRTTVMIAY